MKTVIHVWTNNCCNIKYNPNDTSSYWGIGDLLRGTIKLFQLQRYFKFQLIVDISLHPISAFIENSTHNYTNLIETNKNNISYYYINTLQPYLADTFNNGQLILPTTHNYTNLFETNKNNISYNHIDTLQPYPADTLNNDKIILLTTNDKTIETLPITDNCKLFIKNMLKPKPEFQAYLTNIITNLSIKEYNIFHIRLGDNYLIKNNNCTINFEEFINKLISNNAIEPTKDIIITDNNQLKKYIKTRNDLYTLDTNIKHAGIDTIHESVRDTLVELFLLQNAAKIKTFTVYNWISGFVEWISKIYDIPLISIKNKISF